MSPRSIIVAGATGLVGGACIERLLMDEAFDRVVALTRRPLPERFPLMDPRGKLEQRLIAFDALERDAAQIEGDVVLSALGTTLRAAGSKERFREIDFGYPLELAKIALRNGARQFVLISTMGADSRSRVFYTRVKGELEEAIRGVGYPGVTILRPSFLLGDRTDSRPGEWIVKNLARLAPPKYRAIDVHDVAAAAVAFARESPRGVTIIESAAIRRRARTLRDRP